MYRFEILQNLLQTFGLMKFDMANKITFMNSGDKRFKDILMALHIIFFGSCPTNAISTENECKNVLVEFSNALFEPLRSYLAHYADCL